jgi:predicted GNAT family N-acyltransferase
VKSFYAAHGYREHGDTFLEVEIPHVEMRKDL